MSAIVVVDTSVLMEVLDIPGFNQHRDQVMEKFNAFVEEGAHLFLPTAAVFEAGNHIAQLQHGQRRRASADRFARAIRAALNDEAPWKPIRMCDAKELAEWIDEFPEAAMQGLGVGDLSIKKEWEALCDRHPLSRVLIWSQDRHLAAFDRRIV